MSESTKHTIMVVEDEVLLLQAITKKLELSDLQPIPCASGTEALNNLATGEVKPDAIWLDYYLKDMNGLEFLQRVRQNPEWAAIPVIVVSNSASPVKITSVLALGVSKYVLKAEYRLEDIIKIFKDFIEADIT